MKTYSPTAIWYSGDYTGDMEEDENGKWVSHADAKVEIERLRGLLTRYRDETPLGHQPHMIAHLVDEVLGR